MPPYQKLTRRNGVAARCRLLHGAKDKEGLSKSSGVLAQTARFLRSGKHIQCSGLLQLTISKCSVNDLGCGHSPFRATGQAHYHWKDAATPNARHAPVRAEERETCPNFCAILAVCKPLGDQSCLVATTQKTKQNQKEEPAARTCRNACLGQSEVVGLARERCLHLTIERTRHVLSIFTLMLPRLFLSQDRVFFDAITDMPELGDTVKGCRKLIEEKG